MSDQLRILRGPHTGINLSMVEPTDRPVEFRHTPGTIITNTLVVGQKVLHQLRSHAADSYDVPYDLEYLIKATRIRFKRVEIQYHNKEYGVHGTMFLEAGSYSILQ